MKALLGESATRVIILKFRVYNTIHITTKRASLIFILTEILLAACDHVLVNFECINLLLSNARDMNSTLKM